MTAPLNLSRALVYAVYLFARLEKVKVSAHTLTGESMLRRRDHERARENLSWRMPCLPCLCATLIYSARLLLLRLLRPSRQSVIGNKFWINHRIWRVVWLEIARAVTAAPRRPAMSLRAMQSFLFRCASTFELSTFNSIKSNAFHVQLQRIHNLKAIKLSPGSE